MIKKIIKRILPNIYIFRIQTLLKKIEKFLWNDKHYVKKKYMKITGNKINLENPTLFSEKLNFMKLYNRNTLLTKCTDKFLVRDYITERGYGHLLIPLISVYDNVKEIDFDILPNEFFMKCNHASGTNLYVKDKKSLKEQKIKRMFKSYLKRNHYFMEREWNYKNIKPKVLIERTIKDYQGKLPIDYKFFCFNGEPKIIMICTDLIDKNGEKGNPQCNFYDINFNFIDLKINNDNITNKEIKKPNNLDQMIKISRDLSKEFNFCRVDLFNINKRIFFGELTFIHGAGLLNFMPKKYDKIFGDWLEIKNGEWK